MDMIQSYPKAIQPTQENIITMPRQHQSSRMKKVLSELKRLGFEVERGKSGTYKIIPPPDIKGPIYTTHGTESALHPMRRDFKKYYNIQISV